MSAQRGGGADAGGEHRYLVVGGDPADGHLIVLGEGPATDLHRRDSETLAWAQDVGPHPVDGGGGVDEGRVSMATLLALAQDPERLVDGEGLRIEYLFVCLELEAASGPAAERLPDTFHPNLPAFGA